MANGLRVLFLIRLGSFDHRFGHLGQPSWLHSFIARYPSSIAECCLGDPGNYTPAETALASPSAFPANRLK